MLGSKYVRSELRNCFEKCKNDLLANKFVLFSGTPCQINALCFYLDRYNIDRNNLLTLDIICHGTPTKVSWQKYLDNNFKGKEITDISFRFKKYEWENYYIKVGDYVESHDKDPFMVAFLDNLILCESCFSCECKGEKRLADITIGDFWGIDSVSPLYKNKKGTSIVVIRNHKGIIKSAIRKKCFMKRTPYVSSLFFNSSYYLSSTRNESITFDENKLIIDNNHLLEKSIHKNVKNSFFSLLNRFRIHSYSVYDNKRPRKKSGKIGIITDFGYGNYGNRLQNFALSYLIEHEGRKVYNIRFDSFDKTLFGRLTSRHKKKGQNDIRHFPFKEAVYVASRQYERKIIPFSKTIARQKNLCKFETIVVGSDQIWNADYHVYEHDLEYSLGNFGIINRPFRLVSYGASICLREFNEQQKFLYMNSLKSFDYVSVRENAGKELLDTIGIKSTVVLDPTLLLSAQVWNESILKYSSKKLPNYPFVFQYLLEEKDVLNISAKYKIINILDSKDCYNNSNQFDFVNFIKNAFLVVTDSFHALVFSIIYRKRIFLTKTSSDGMNSRFEELFSLLNIELRYDSYYDFSCIDYSKLDVNREKSLIFLKKAI